MDIGEIYKGFFPYAGSVAEGKVRPAVFLFRDGYNNAFYKITTQYGRKSDFIKAKYFPIKDWVSAGLHKPSFIDTNRYMNVDDDSVKEFVRIGSLTAKDLENFKRFDERKKAWLVSSEELSENPIEDETEDIDELEFEP
jgi:hypothetical protein